jgi:all-trans-8'-apo-beta-carotenal 15,15'-oxygenase
VQVELQGSTSGFQTYLRFYEFSDDMQVLTVQNFDLPGYAFIHDFAITDDSIVLMVNASSLHLKDFVLGSKGIIHCIGYDEEKPLKVSNYWACLNVDGTIRICPAGMLHLLGS